jgi:NAD+ diphosphatase
VNSPERPPLSRFSYDRAAHRRTEDTWLAAAWPRSRVVVVSPKSTMPTDGAGGLVLRDPVTIDAGASRRFLGVIDDVPHFAATIEPDHEGTWQTLREVGAVADELPAALVTSAIALEQWHQRHTHCPRCGAATVETHAGWTRTCTADGSEHFPRTDPAVIMLVHDGGDRTLLGRGPEWNPGRFSTLAGFVEPGESLEAAVAREVYEEVGVGVTDIEYVASQPWPFPASLMVGFSARLDGDPTLTLDPVEMAEAAWFSRAEVSAARTWTDGAGPEPDAPLHGISPHLSISRYLIDRWLDVAPRSPHVTGPSG